MNSQNQTQNKNDYVIVDFPDESINGEICMALISSTWIFEEKGVLYCNWPTYLKSTLLREKVVKSHAPLQHEKCKKCVVVVKYTSDDYDKASLKLKRLEDESERSSSAEADEEQTIKKNKSYKSNRHFDFLYSDESDGDDTFIPPAPKFPEEKRTAKSYVQMQPTTPDRYSNRFTEEKTPKSYHDMRPLNTNDGNNTNSNRFPDEGKIAKSVDEMRPLRLSDDRNNKFTRANSSLSNKSSQQQKEEAELDQKCHCEKNAKMLERLLRDMQTIKLDVKSIMQDLNNTKLTEFEQLDGQLHFQEYNDLKIFNEKLTEEDYFNKMQASISLLGGRDLNDTTRKILSLLISHNLSLTIHWIGVNEKGSFQKLTNILKLIYGAVRKNVSTSNSTNTEIDNSIRSWIKNAPDRAGGRANRRKNKV